MSDYQTPYETKDFTGALFANDKREKETDPNAKGSVVIAGVEYWVSAWTNTSKAGKRYQSLKFTAKQEAHNAGMQGAREAIQGDPEPSVFDQFEDDSIPF